MLTGMGFDRYGYGYLQVAWIPKLVLVCTIGSTWIDTARRGQLFPSCQFIFVNTAEREKPFPSHWFVCVCSTLLCPTGTDRNRLVPSGFKWFRLDSNWNHLESSQNHLEPVGIRSEPLGTNQFRSVPGARIINPLSKWNQIKWFKQIYYYIYYTTYILKKNISKKGIT